MDTSTHLPDNIEVDPVRGFYFPYGTPKRLRGFPLVIGDRNILRLRSQLSMQRCQETCQATLNARCQGSRAECFTLKRSSLVSREACRGNVICLSRGESAVS